MNDSAIKHGFQHFFKITHTRDEPGPELALAIKML